MELQEDEELQDAEIEEEQRVIRELGGVCQGYDGPDTIVNIAQTPSQLFKRIAEGAKYKFFDYKAMQWIACNLQYNFSLAHSLRRWAIFEQVQNAITNLSRINAITAEGDVWRAKFKNISDFILLKTSKSQSDDAHMYHEFFVGSLFTNNLRQWIPHFMFVYAIFKCSRPRFAGNNRTDSVSFCEYSTVSDLNDILTPEERQNLKEYERLIKMYDRTGRYAEAQEIEDKLEAFTVISENYLDNPINYIVIENIEGGLGLNEHIRRDKPPFHEILGHLLQLTSALEMALEQFDFCHYDMHSGNVLMRPIKATNNKRTFVPVGYEKPNQARYFVESNYIPTIIDYSRCHVKRRAGLARRTVDHGNHLLKEFGIYADRSRPIYDLYKLVGFVTMDILHRYNPKIRNPSSLVPSRQRTIVGGVTTTDDNLAIAQETASRISNEDFYNIVRLWNFFPFFRSLFEFTLLGSTADKVKPIFFILEESSLSRFNIENKWEEAERYPLKNDIYAKFTGYLMDAFPKEVQKVLFREDQLPPLQSIFISSCDFNNCQ